jgi:hypothetical protein
VEDLGVGGARRPTRGDRRATARDDLGAMLGDELVKQDVLARST